MIKSTYYRLMACIFITLLSTASHATKTEIWKKDQANESSIEHRDWQTILSEYITEKKQAGSDYPTNFFKYSAVT